MPDALQLAKSELRVQMVDQRARMHADARASASAAIVARIAESSVFRAARAFCSFAPMREEVQVTPLVEMAARHGCRIFMPVFDSGTRVYRLRLWDTNLPLRVGRWNILEPEGEGFGVPEGCVCMVVPGLVFDRAGGRIGYGGGYFDRMLREARSLPGRDVSVIGVAYSFQVLAHVPSGDQDEPVDAVVTESEWMAT